MSDDAPLIETADAKAPPGAEAAWVSGAGGARLRAALFSPAAVSAGGRARGSIVLSGGRTEPIEKYYEFIADCLDRGFVVLAHDWRGQGLSRRDLADPLKGHAKGFKPFLDDFRLLLNAYEPRLPKPWLAVGHSMGGGLTLLAMAQGETRFAGAILSAPMLGLSTPFPIALSRLLTGLNVVTGRGSAYTLGGPGKPYDSTFEGNVLTHDPVRHARTWSLIAAEPRLALGAPTWGWVDFALRATAFLARPEALRNVTVPVTIVSAEDDKLVDTAAQAAAARHLPQGKFVNVPGAYHEILMETDPMRNFFMRALDALTGRVAPTPAEPPKPAPAATPTAAPAAAATPAPAPVTIAPAAVAKPAVAKPATAKSAASKPAARKPAAKKAAPAKAAPAKAAAKPVAKPAAAKASAAKASGAKASTAKVPAAKPAAKPAKAVTVKAPVAKATTAPKKVAAKPPAKPAAARPPAAAKKPAAKPAVAKTPAAKPAAARKAAPAKATAAKAVPTKPASVKAAPAKAAPAKAPAAAKKPAAVKKPAARKPAPKPTPKPV